MVRGSRPDHRLRGGRGLPGGTLQPASFEGWTDREEIILDVATDAEETVVGYVLALPTSEIEPTFSLAHIYVIPDRWGTGIGTRLLDHLQNRIRSRGGTRIELGVMAENDRAIEFYETAGYERVDEFYDDRIETWSYTYAKEID
ncbi:MAG: GNAT family N-acetyltransferase [Halobacteriales archaeon]